VTLLHLLSLLGAVAAAVSAVLMRNRAIPVIVNTILSYAITAAISAAYATSTGGACSGSSVWSLEIPQHISAYTLPAYLVGFNTGLMALGVRRRVSLPVLRIAAFNILVFAGMALLGLGAPVGCMLVDHYFLHILVLSITLGIAASHSLVEGYGGSSTSVSGLASTIAGTFLLLLCFFTGAERIFVETAALPAALIASLPIVAGVGSAPVLVPLSLVTVSGLAYTGYNAYSAFVILASSGLAILLVGADKVRAWRDLPGHAKLMVLLMGSAAALFLVSGYSSFSGTLAWTSLALLSLAIVSNLRGDKGGVVVATVSASVGVAYWIKGEGSLPLDSVASMLSLASGLTGFLLLAPDYVGLVRGMPVRPVGASAAFALLSLALISLSLGPSTVTVERGSIAQDTINICDVSLEVKHYSVTHSSSWMALEPDIEFLDSIVESSRRVSGLIEEAANLSMAMSEEEKIQSFLAGMRVFRARVVSPGLIDSMEVRDLSANESYVITAEAGAMLFVDIDAPAIEYYAVSEEGEGHVLRLAVEVRNVIIPRSAFGEGNVSLSHTVFMVNFTEPMIIEGPMDTSLYVYGAVLSPPQLIGKKGSLRWSEAGLSIGNAVFGITKARLDAGMARTSIPANVTPTVARYADLISRLAGENKLLALLAALEPQSLLEELDNYWKGGDRLEAANVPSVLVYGYSIGGIGWSWYYVMPTEGHTFEYTISLTVPEGLAQCEITIRPGQEVLPDMGNTTVYWGEYARTALRAFPGRPLAASALIASLVGGDDVPAAIMASLYPDPVSTPEYEVTRSGYYYTGVLAPFIWLVAVGIHRAKDGT